MTSIIFQCKFTVDCIYCDNVFLPHSSYTGCQLLDSVIKCHGLDPCSSKVKFVNKFIINVNKNKRSFATIANYFTEFVPVDLQYGSKNDVRCLKNCMFHYACELKKRICAVPSMGALNNIWMLFMSTMTISSGSVKLPVSSYICTRTLSLI